MAKLQELKMSRTGNRALLLIAVVAGLVAAALVFIALQDNDGGGSAPIIATDVETVEVVVATGDIEAGTEVTETMLEVINAKEFAEQVEALGGYSTENTGLIIDIS